jgi:hypothetical protein
VSAFALCDIGTLRREYFAWTKLILFLLHSKKLDMCFPELLVRRFVLGDSRRMAYRRRLAERMGQ